MKKFFLIWAVLVLAAPAMALVTITATQVGTTADVDITATTSGEGTIPRAFALDITVDSGQTITDVSGFFSGECDDVNRGYGIFPASFAREIDADDPDWADVNYTPVAEQCDLTGDTQGGEGTSGVTIEMGSLYVDDNSPPSPATLCTITVSGSCYVSLALNIGRGKIVMEDGNEPASVALNGTSVTIEEVCIVPDVVGLAQAAAITAIENEGLVASSTSGHDCTVTAGYVISQNPTNGGTQVDCGSTVNIVVADGDTDVPDVVGDQNDVAQLAIIAAGLTVGTITPVDGYGAPIGEVMAQNPAAGVQPCGTAVDIDVSAECMKSTHPDYANWSLHGKPDCWCYRKQCHGDTDGLAEGPFWVSPDDKTLMVAALNQIVLPPNGECADLNHKSEGPFAVSPDDKTISVQYLNQIVVPDCDGTYINYWKN